MEFALCLLKEIDEEIDFFSFEREREISKLLSKLLLLTFIAFFYL
jgi:hypothetical protein